MKKFIYSALAAIGLLLSPSCSDENEVLSSSENEALVSFNVNLADGISTKAENNTSLDNGTEAKNLVVEVYETETAESSLRPIYRKEKMLTGLTGNVVDFVLVKGKKYEIIFWAQNQTPNDDDSEDSEDCYYDVSDLRTITVNYNDDLSNLKERDAFLFVKKRFSIDEPTTTNVTLTRPFAQMNFMVPKDDVDKAIQGGMDFSVAKTSVTITNVATQLNTLSNKITGDSKSVTFKANAIPFKEKASNLDNETDFLEPGEPSKRYYFLATNYFLVDTKGESSTDALANGDAPVVTATLNINDGSDSYTLVVPNLPVKQNYRTNIYGNLLTTTGKFNVTIDPIINDDPDNNKEYVNTLVQTAITANSIEDLQSYLANDQYNPIKIGTDFPEHELKQLTIDRPVVIDGQNNTIDKVAFTVTTNEGVTIKNATIKAIGNPYAITATNLAGELTVTNCHFTTTAAGLNITTAATGANITVKDCSFLGPDNESEKQTNQYLKIAAANGVSTDATLKIVNSTFTVANAIGEGISPTTIMTFKNLCAAKTTIGRNMIQPNELTYSEKISVSFHDKTVTSSEFVTAFIASEETVVNNIN